MGTPLDKLAAPGKVNSHLLTSKLSEPITLADPSTLRDDGEELLPFQDVALQDDDATDSATGLLGLVPSYVRSPSEAMDWCRHQHEYPSFWWQGQCLKFVRMSRNVPSKYYDADQAWYYGANKHYHMDPPRGTPFFFAIGNHGHVVESCGDGTCWSSDILRIGKVDRVSLGAFARSWGARPRGWTESLNGVDIYDGGRVYDASWVQYRTRHQEAYKYGTQLKAWVRAETHAMRGYESMSRSTKLGPHFRNNAALVQKKAGVASPYDGLLGVQSLTWLVSRHSSTAHVIA